MKRTVSIITAGLAAAALTLGGASIASADTSAPDADEKSALAFSREEEKMAHDLYTEFGKLYDSAVWDRIANSEQRHFDAIGRLLDQFDVADPSDGKKAGVFDDEDVQKLYDDWLKQGKLSEEDAFKAAIALETRDIADLKVQIEETDNDDIDAVYERLLAGSESHLAAFTAWSKGETYRHRPQRHRPTEAGPTEPVSHVEAWTAPCATAPAWTTRTTSKRCPASRHEPRQRLTDSCRRAPTETMGRAPARMRGRLMARCAPGGRRGGRRVVPPEW